MKPLMINLNKHEYQNKTAAQYLIRYITRTRCDEDKSHQFYGYGSYHGYMYQKPVEELINEFRDVQKYHKADGCLMCHYVILIPDDLFARMNNDYQILSAYASACCNYIFNLGHQACFGIHVSDSRKLHIHLAINAVNFKTGSKLRQYPTEIYNIIESPLCNLASNFVVPQKVSSLDDL